MISYGVAKRPDVSRCSPVKLEQSFGASRGRTAYQMAIPGEVRVLVDHTAAITQLDFREAISVLAVVDKYVVEFYIYASDKQSVGAEKKSSSDSTCVNHPILMQYS